MITIPNSVEYWQSQCSKMQKIVEDAADLYQLSKKLADAQLLCFHVFDDVTGEALSQRMTKLGDSLRKAGYDA